MRKNHPAVGVCQELLKKKSASQGLKPTDNNQRLKLDYKIKEDNLESSVES